MISILIIYSGNFSPEATNDSEQLRITLAKCRSTLANDNIDIGDVALHGIQEYEQSINDNNDNVQESKCIQSQHKHELVASQ